MNQQVKPKTEIEMRNYIEKLGYDIQKINKGSYWTVAIWFKNVLKGESDKQYKTWQLAESTTIENMYKHLIKKK